jgi:hypothetical protein
VVMGKGRPYFGEMSLEDVALGDPTVCIQGGPGDPPGVPRH